MNSPEHNNYTRRQFLGASMRACAAVGTTSMLSTIMNLRQVNAAAALNGDNTDFKALVCLFLYGGNDSSNMVIPRSTTEYNQYTAARGHLALAMEDLIPLTEAPHDPPETYEGPDLAFHPSMVGCKSLFDDENLAVLVNVGTLIEPVDIFQYRNGTAALPPHLFSHNDQQVLWQTSVPHTPAAFHQTGWGGRIADLLHSVHNNGSVSMNVSLSGSNFFQVGESILPFRINSSGANGYEWSGSSNERDLTRYQALRQLFARDYANMLEEAFSDVSNQAIEDSDTINAALANTSDFSEMLPDSGLGSQLNMIAKIIQAHEALGMQRQIYFCATGGFDTHGPQLAAHAGLLAGVDAGVKGFSDAMNSIGLGESVTLFTASDFGRTFDSNGRGSDHGWGGHHLVSGGAVNGGRFYGQFPALELGTSPQDTGRGRWLPTTGVDQYGATLAKWFGVDASNMDTVFPNLPNFSNTDLGFMG